MVIEDPYVPNGIRKISTETPHLQESKLHQIGYFEKEILITENIGKFIYKWIRLQYFYNRTQ